MILKKEKASHGILEDLDARNHNWNLIEQPFHFDEDLGEYVNVSKFWDGMKNGKIYTVEFNQFSVTPNPDGIKKDDNEGLVVIPSTASEANRDDYDKIGLFKSIDVNAYVDEDDIYHITAIKGDGRFKSDGTNGDVYVMSMVGYQKKYSDDEVWGISYSDTMHPEFEPLHEAVMIDGRIRPYLLHAKYIAGINPKDGKLASISGVPAEYAAMSHNDQITKFKSKGTQYSGKTTHDDYYVQLMVWLKYATTNSQSVLYGATSAYYLQYTNKVAENGVNRVIITNDQASNLLIGSTVSIGDYTGGSSSTDRQAAVNYNLANRVLVTEIEDVGGGNSAVYVASDTFDTTLNTTITTYPYNSGYCDSVLGRDGSPVNPLSGKEPFIINGIEIMIGGYEVIQNLIIQNNATDNRIDVYVNYDASTYATSITSAYTLAGQIASTNNVWQYISEIDMPQDHSSVILPIATDASSSTGFADGLYSNPPSTGGTRVWLSLGNLSHGATAGLRPVYGNSALSFSYWLILGRLSATGRSKGV